MVPLTEISQYLIDATLAAEDANFYSNPGLEPRGIARAIYQNLSEQEIVMTITNGRAGKGMPSFKGLIDQETMEMLAKYIKDDLRLR